MAEQIVAQCTSFYIGTVLSISQWIRILHISSFHLHSTEGSNSSYSLSYTRLKFLCKMCVYATAPSTAAGTQLRCGGFMFQNSSFRLMFLHAYFVKTLYDTVMYVLFCSMIVTIVSKYFTGIMQTRISIHYMRNARFVQRSVYEQLFMLSS